MKREKKGWVLVVYAEGGGGGEGKSTLYKVRGRGEGREGKEGRGPLGN